MPASLDDETLRRELHELVDDVRPRPGLADAAIGRRRVIRRRAGGAAGVAAALAAGIVVALASSDSAPAPAPQLRLAGYRFRLPHDATPVTRTPAACALDAMLGFNVNPDTHPGVGTSSANQPAIQSAVTAADGCVSMTISDPYTPGSRDAPFDPYGFKDPSPVTIDGDSGTIGERVLYGGDMSANGIAIPNGTTDNALLLHIPTAGGQVQLLFVTAAGVSQDQLQSIVASGLQPSGAAPAARR